MSNPSDLMEIKEEHIRDKYAAAARAAAFARPRRAL